LYVSMCLPERIDMTSKTPKGLRVKNRHMSKVTAVCLHQTAMSRGSNAGSYLDVKAHYVVMPDGTSVQLHPVESFLNASSWLNDVAIAIEIVGNFADDRGNWWEGKRFGKSVLSQQQIEGARELVSHLAVTHDLKNIFGHRQGEKASERGNCPGPDIWYNIAEWALKWTDLEDGGAGYKVGPGSAIPHSWRKPRTAAR